MLHECAKKLRIHYSTPTHSSELAEAIVEEAGKDGPICSVATETALRKSVLDLGILSPFGPKRQPGSPSRQGQTRQRLSLNSVSVLHFRFL